MVNTKEFEERFLFLLKERLLSSTSASKNKINLLENKEKVGEIYIQYLRRANGYYAGLEVYGGAVHDFCIKANPPYKTRLFNQSTLSMTSLSEENKLFGDTLGGTISMPKQQDIDNTIIAIISKLNNIYYSRAINLIEAKAELIDDVTSNPEVYSYPFLVIIYAAKNNNIGFESDLITKAIKRKSVVGDKEFDLSFAQKFLSS